MGLRVVMGCRGFRGHWGGSGVSGVRRPAGGEGSIGTPEGVGASGGGRWW